MGTQSHFPVSLPSSFEPLFPVNSPSDPLFSLPADSSSVATSHIGQISQGLRKKQRSACGQGYIYERSTTISMLPDNVLLEIFDFYKENDDHLFDVWKWHFLVHVCRTWRQVVFESPLRLNLSILCTARTPSRQNMGVWPALPLFIDYHYYFRLRYGGASKEDNAIAALEHPNRVREVKLVVTGSHLEKITTVMQEPFPVLTNLLIKSKDGNAPVMPVELLGGEAPCLQFIYLRRIPFPALPTLLLSTSDLVTLHLRNIPPTGYISPEAMAVGLAALPKLHTFVIEFQSATPRPDLIHLPPVTPIVPRIVLPALDFFQFKGASDYLEGFATRIDAPQLNRIFIRYLNQGVDFRVPRLSRFIDRSGGPKLTLFKHAHVIFYDNMVTFNTSPHADNVLYVPHSRTIIDCQGIDWQAWHIAQVLSYFSATLSHVVHLKLDKLENHFKPRQREDPDEIEWLDLLRQFSAVQTLYVPRELTGYITPALERITAEMVAEVLPSLDLIYLGGERASSIKKFIASCKLSGRSVTVVNTRAEFDERLKSYITEEEPGQVHDPTQAPQFWESLAHLRNADLVTDVRVTEGAARTPRCWVCGLLFRRPQELRRHMVQVHTTARKCPFKPCTYNWSRPNKIRAHIIEVHPSELDPMVFQEMMGMRWKGIVEFVDACEFNPYLSLMPNRKCPFKRCTYQWNRPTIIMAHFLEVHNCEVHNCELYPEAFQDAQTA